jgi:enoyl-CoA hydratase/carnithine racemase
MTNTVVRHELRGNAFWITITRPDKRNAMNADVIAGIRDGWRAAHADPAVRVIVLTGEGTQAFCSGADLQPGVSFTFDTSQPTMPVADLLREVRSGTLPAIARVNGACMAGGFALLAMCDLAIAVDHAMFGLPEVKVGVFPMQVLAVLKDLVPQRKLREWCLTGERFGAQEAMEAGLLNGVVPEAQLDASVQAMVDRLTAASPTAQRRGLYAMNVMQGLTTEQALAFAESQIALVAATQDAKEGLAAFNEKRKPRWTGR